MIELQGELCCRITSWGRSPELMYAKCQKWGVVLGLANSQTLFFLVRGDWTQGHSSTELHPQLLFRAGAL